MLPCMCLVADFHMATSPAKSTQNAQARPAEHPLPAKRLACKPVNPTKLCILTSASMGRSEPIPAHNLLKTCTLQGAANSADNPRTRKA